MFELQNDKSQGDVFRHTKTHEQKLHVYLHERGLVFCDYWMLCVGTMVNTNVKENWYSAKQN